MIRLIVILSCVVMLLVINTTCRDVSYLIGGSEVGNSSTKEWESSNVTTSEFPYMATLEFKGKFKCGAVIIRAKTVLTAAHCVKGLSSKSFSVRAGTLKRNDETGEYVQKVDVKSKVVHEQYKPNGDNAHDIAILKLKDSFNFDDYIQSIQLAESSQVEEFTHEKVIALGFGEMEGYVDSQTLRMAYLQVISKASCKREIRYHTTDMLCTLGYYDLAGVACGDSGGPLVARHSAEDYKNDILIGIATNCVTSCNPPVACNLKYPSVFEDVAAVRDWIDKNI